MAERKGRGGVQPRKFGWPRFASQISGNTQKLRGNVQ